MTSAATPQVTSAPKSSAATTSTPSYASAAGATTSKPTSTPPIAAGTNPPPVVVGSSSAPAQHAKQPSSASPLNGRPSITPAVPAVVHGSSNMNGGPNDQSRKSSVTISANGPSSYAANGAPMGSSKSAIQFGFKDSPAIAHSTPQAAPLPIPIPGGNPRIPSPSHSPSPIPQPSASGGRPPAGLQQQPGASHMTFGSLGSDGERHMRQASIPQNASGLGSQPPAHIRRESGVSNNGDLGGGSGGPGPGNGRPGFPPQGGRGRAFNPPYNNAPHGYPPNQPYRGNGQGRGGMPPSFHPGRPMQPYPNSPGPTRSPALAQSQPGTPNIPPATMQMPLQTPPQYHYQPPMAPAPQQFGYPPQGQFDQFGRPLYNYPMQFMPPPQTNSPGYPQHFVPAPQYHAPAPQSMSRTSSHSERPTSSTGQPSQPVVVSGTPQPSNTPAKLPIVSSNNFVRPKRGAAITIKDAQGKALDLTSIKAPSSPGPNIQLSKTPPVVSSTPTPPPKPSTPSHGRTDSHATPKTAKEVQDELREKIKQATKAPVESKAKSDEEEAAARAKAAEEEQQKQAEAAAKALAEEKVKEEEARKAAEEEKRKADAAQAAAEAEAKAKASETKPAEAQKEEVDEDEEMERMIREMEEAEARREQEAEAYSKKKAADAEAKKKQDEAQRLANAAENDRLLREAEREMERLEEEKERKRNAAEAKGQSLSIADALAKAGSEPAGTPDKIPGSPNLGDVADKLAGLNISDESRVQTPTEASASGAKPSAAEKQRAGKPAALNLTLSTKPVEPPQPSAALQSLKSARFLTIMDQGIYPAGISSPNPALNAAVAKKGKTFKYDAQFLLQFQKVFTEQPSVEFHQQVKSLIGDTDGSRSASTPRTSSGRPGTKAGVGHPFSGTIGVPQPMPNVRGSTSQDRFAASNAALGRNPMAGPMGSFRPTGSFPMGAPHMSRTPSSSNVAMPNSPRQGSRSTRGGSKRNDFNAKEAQAAKTMPLTQGQEVKPITVSATGWKPTSLASKGPSASSTNAGHLDPEGVQRKVKAALNKMTPEKFDKIADQILQIAGQSKDESDGRTLRQVIQLTFEKATDEAHWASMYAKFCKRMLDMMSPEIRDENIKDKNGVVVSGGALFRKYLLNRCQEEFERGWKSNLPEPKEGEDANKTLEAAMLSDEYYIAAAAKRRGLGLVQFIGELYKLGMLTERIMHECVRKLVDYEGTPDEAEIESLSKLLKTIGANLDATEKGKMLMNAYFERIVHMTEIPDLPSRLKFMLMDVVDLRKAEWASKEANKGPKTLDEVRAEVEAQAIQRAQEAARSSQRGPPGGRPPLGRGDARNFSSNFSQPASNQVGMDDLRRLKGSANRTSSQGISLGPTSMFASRSNSGRRLGPGGSLGRAGEESGASSRTGTPPTREHANTFSLLANMDTDNPASPPSTAASPSLSKVTPDSSATDKKEGGS